MTNINTDISGFEVYQKLMQLKSERNDIENVINVFSELDIDNTFSASFISDLDIESVSLFENNIIFPIQGTRAYSSFSPELEKFFLFDLKPNDKQIITKAKKDLLLLLSI